MHQCQLPAVFMRGGTSKAVMFRQQDLPQDRQAWAAIFLRVMGSPDPFGRQLDGMGGGISSLSKVCVVGVSKRADADVDYTFAQVAVDRAEVDYAGNCGNMSAAVGPFALDEGLLARPNANEATVRIYNTNTNKIIRAHFPVEDDKARVDGPLHIDGVNGTGAAIKLEFMHPGGTQTGSLLPTGNALDTLDVPGYGSIDASLVDAANPCVFVRASDVGVTGIELPDELEATPQLMSRLEAIRCAASVRMGLCKDFDAASQVQSIPKIAMVTTPVEAKTLSGQILVAGDYSILARMVSMQRIHKALPVTGAICLGLAMAIPNSLPYQCKRDTGEDMVIAHPSGMIEVAGLVEQQQGQMAAVYGSVYRTARRLFAGQVYYPSA